MNFDDCPFRFIAGDCDACDGDGEICVGIGDPYGGGPERLDPPYPIMEPCPVCGGEGDREVEVEPICLEDLEELPP